MAEWKGCAMQTRNKVLDDLSQLMTNAMGVAQGARTEAENAMKGWIDRWLADRDFVTREEFEAVRAMAQKARERMRLRRWAAVMQALSRADGLRDALILRSMANPKATLDPEYHEALIDLHDQIARLGDDDTIALIAAHLARLDREVE
jgi:BMFP domain-containing protein YqiC